MTAFSQKSKKSGIAALLLVGVWTADVQAVPGPRSEAAPWIGRFTARHVITASTPDNSFEMLKKFYGSAQEWIHISVYELDSPFIGDILEEAVDRGVALTVLVDGAPVGRFPKNELYIAKRLKSKGAKFYFYDIPNGRANRLFSYTHAKYGIVDGKRVIVGSANYNSNSHPVNPTFGNREWEVVLDDRQAAALFEKAFQHDLAQKEWVEYGGSPRYKLEDPSYKPERRTRGGKYELALEPADVHEVPVQTVFAPDNTLKQSPLLGALSQAKSTIDIQQASFETYWGDKKWNPVPPEDSPMMKIILGQARAGRGVRILLNDDDVYRRNPGVLEDALAVFARFVAPALEEEEKKKAPRDNLATQAYLTRVSKREGLNLTVRLSNYRDCGVYVLHNKGYILDQEVTLVSSINWGEGSMKLNREAGVLLKSEEVAAYYEKAFNHDWACAGRRSDD